MKSNPFSCWATRSLRLSALRLAFCSFLLLASDVRADLTPAQLQDAFVAALKAYAEYSSGYDYYLGTLPYRSDEEQIGNMLQGYASGIYGQVNGTVGDLAAMNALYWRTFLLKYAPAMSSSNQLEAIVAALGTPTGSPSQGWEDGLGNMLSRWYGDWYDMLWERLYPKLEWLTYTQQSELLVHDEQTHADLLDIYTRLDLLGDIYDRLGDSYAFGENLSSNIYEMGDRIIEWNEDYWNEDPDPYKSDGESEGESGYDEEEDEAKDEWDEIAPPSVDDSYHPEVDPAELEGEDLGLSDVSDPGDHNALVRLLRGGGNNGFSENGLPEIEIDFGRMASLENGMRSFASFTGWLYRSLFLLYLSIKGIAMWRVVRTASVSASLGEANPIVHLAWNPF